MLYHDRFIDCDDDEVRIRWYYFPFGTKHVRYDAISEVRRFRLTNARGRLRLWGTGTFSYWAGLDPGRLRKSVGFLVDTGRRVKILVTPEDPDAFAGALQERLVRLREEEATPF